MLQVATIIVTIKMWYLIEKFYHRLTILEPNKSKQLILIIPDLTYAGVAILDTIDIVIHTIEVY